MTDTLALSADFVHLSHNAGLAACGDRLAVLGLRSQTIHLLQVCLQPLPPLWTVNAALQDDDICISSAVLDASCSLLGCMGQADWRQNAGGERSMQGPALRQVLPDGRFSPLAQLGPHLAPDDELVLAQAAADEARWRAAQPQVWPLCRSQWHARPVHCLAASVMSFLFVLAVLCSRPCTCCP